MNILVTCVSILLTFAGSLLLIYIAIYQFYNRIYLDNKYRMDENFLDSMDILHNIIKYELLIFERDIFSNKNSISNSNYESFYRDLTSKIIEKVSSNLIENITKYVNEEYIYTVISREVKNYLNSKVAKI